MRCRPGDLAEIIKDIRFPQNVYRRLAVILHPTSREAREFGCHEPACEWVAHPLQPIWAESLSGESRLTMEEVCPYDSQLRPIRDPLPNESVPASEPADVAFG